MSMSMPEPRIGNGGTASSSSSGYGLDNGIGEDVRETSSSSSRRNPLVDLIDSEKGYIEQLGLVIRVSPPPFLLSPFQSIHPSSPSNKVPLDCMEWNRVEAEFRTPSKQSTESSSRLVKKGFPPSEIGYNVSNC